MESARDRALQGNRDWLTSNWLYTVASLLEEGDTLALELQHVPTDVHGSDVIAMKGGATEHMPDNWRSNRSSERWGGLLPFLANHEGDQARRLVAATLAWLQNKEGLFVDSQGEVDTQAAPASPWASMAMRAPMSCARSSSETVWGLGQEVRHAA
eukprot:s5958_g1.t1